MDREKTCGVPKMRYVSLICQASLLLTMVALLNGCNNLKEEDLYGTYVAKYPFGTEILTLKARGEYTQEADIIVDAKIITHKGHWRFNAPTQNVLLEGSLVVQDGYGHLDRDYRIPWRGVSAEPVFRFFPWSRIKLGGDEHVQFEKVPEPVSETMRTKPTEEAKGVRDEISPYTYLKKQGLDKKGGLPQGRNRK